MASVMPTSDDYTIGLICAFDAELVAAGILLDEEHDDLLIPRLELKHLYCRQGRSHTIVIACLPTWMIEWLATTTCATNLLRSFSRICLGSMVGIGGAATEPLGADPREDPTHRRQWYICNTNATLCQSTSIKRCNQPWLWRTLGQQQIRIVKLSQALSTIVSSALFLQIGNLWMRALSYGVMESG